ncbi:hypothetical protein WN48_02764 [Eufriesea mexicana]|uniref:Uncharacterized protein n=1 Tax=Eufriesea mexicana TaxID=516756 RepID=A0A310S4J8_9HYME|nr:hypothetical protein WN48_02764 [Eufriesea mexicana]
MYILNIRREKKSITRLYRSKGRLAWGELGAIEGGDGGGGGAGGGGGGGGGGGKTESKSESVNM